MPKIIDNLRETILEQARAIVVNEGFDSLTIRRVSKDMGIAVGTIYNYFSTKDALIVQLMEDYWYAYLKEVDMIHLEEADLYKKLQRIYEKLEVFFDTFKEVWIKNLNTGYTEDSLTRKKSIVEKLNRRIESILTEEVESGKIQPLDEPYTTAKFIMLNFLAMVQMKGYSYQEFESIIRKLL